MLYKFYLKKNLLFLTSLYNTWPWYYDKETILNIHKNDHTHEALQDSIELKDILQGLKDKF